MGRMERASPTGAGWAGTARANGCRAVILSLVWLCCPPAHADSASVQTGIVLRHAEMSRDSESLAVSQVHLRHVINCLVGLTAPAFDARFANPCANMPNGLLQQGSAVSRARLREGLLLASRGVAAKSLNAAHAAAAQLVGLLHAVRAGEQVRLRRVL